MVGEIKRALDVRLRRKVALACAYSLLHRHGVEQAVVSPPAISITANQGSAHIEVEPILPNRKCQEDIHDLAQYVSRNKNSYFILTLPSGSS